IDLRCEPFNADRLRAKGVECVFGCLPHGVSMQTLPALLERGMRVIDLSADYRLRDPNVYAQWYGESHEDLAHLAQAVYGLPEIEQALSDVGGEPVEVIFTPHLVPMDRGIFTTIYATPHRPLSQPELLELYRAYYARAPFVRVVDHLPATKHTTGTNFLDVTV